MGITKTDAMSLAVRYAAYCEASIACEDNAIACWGSCLRDTQHKIGVYVVPAHLLDASLELANARLAKAKAKAAQATLPVAYEPAGDIAAD